MAEDRIRAHFRDQAESCRRLGSPFTALVCELLAERLSAATAFGSRVLSWPGDPRADALSLRAAGAFNALARSAHRPALTAVYPPAAPVAEPLWAGLAAAMSAHDAALTRFLDSPPQTNEVKRCSALLGGALVAARETGLPLDLLEIGASAGLNLGFDRYRYELGGAGWGRADAPVTIRSEWRAGLPPLDAPLAVRARRACDLNPLDPGTSADRERMLCYIWPDQADRLATTAAALAAAAAAPWRVERADAARWLEARLAEPPERGSLRLLMHSIMWQYMPLATRERIAAAMAAAGAAATPDRPLGWLSMEPGTEPGSAAVTLRLWPGGAARVLGQADFHGRWVAWA